MSDSQNKTLDNLSQFMDAAAITQLVETYIDRAQSHIDNASNSINEKDSENLRIAIHTLKGSSANVGLMKLSEYCAEAEADVSDATDFEKMSEKIESIARLFKDGKEQLLRYISSS